MVIWKDVCCGLVIVPIILGLYMFGSKLADSIVTSAANVLNGLPPTVEASEP